MSEFSIIMPSRPRVILEEGNVGVYEIEGLYPGYGHTLGNSLRRIILSSLPGAAVTAVKIDGVNHEFSTISGVKEDVIAIILNLKKIRFKLATEESQTVTLAVKGARAVSAADLKVPGQVTVMNLQEHIATLTEKGAELSMELTVERGLGYVPKEILHREKVEVGTIALDAVFTPIRKVHYEVENMRVGNRTDYNRLKVSVETDGIITPREALEHSIETMINQLKAIVGFEEREAYSEAARSAVADESVAAHMADSAADPAKIKIEDLNFSVRTQKALGGAGIRTIAGLAKKKEQDILEISGLGEKGLEEIKSTLAHYGLSLK